MGRSVGQGYSISEKLGLVVKKRGGKGGREGVAAASGDRHYHPTLVEKQDSCSQHAFPCSYRH